MVTPVVPDTSSPVSPASPPPPPLDVFTAASFEGAGGFARHWDLCSSTPFSVLNSPNRSSPSMIHRVSVSRLLGLRKLVFLA
jgi:hypothetical protein